MKQKEKRIQKRILRQFKNVKPDKLDKIKRIDLWNSILCLEESGKLYKYNSTIYFLDKDTCYCLFDELEKLEKELNQY